MTENTEPKSSERLGELIAIGTRLLEEIESFAQDGGRQFVDLAHRAQTNRRLITLTLFGFVLNMGFTVALIIFGFQVNSNQHSIDSLAHRLDVAQTVQRQKALCPLYQIFLDSRSDAARKAAPDPQAYDHAFTVIESGYSVLGCSAFISGQ
jgi:hypothetical protein